MATIMTFDARLHSRSVAFPQNVYPELLYALNLAPNPRGQLFNFSVVCGGGGGGKCGSCIWGSITSPRHFLTM